MVLVAGEMCHAQHDVLLLLRIKWIDSRCPFKFETHQNLIQAIAGY